MLRSRAMLWSFLGLAFAGIAVAQPGGGAVPPTTLPAVKPQEGEKPQDKAQEKPAEAEEPNRKPAEPLRPRQIKLFLNDGTIIAGDLTIDSFNVQTEFGNLKVPIEKLRMLTPGLDSTPGVAEKINKLIADLARMTTKFARKPIGNSWKWAAVFEPSLIDLPRMKMPSEGGTWERSLRRSRS